MVEFDRERALKSPARARTEKPARAQSSAPKPEPPAAPPAAAPIKAVSHVSSSNVTSPSTFIWLAPALLIAAGCLHAVIQEQLMHELGHLPLLITSFEFGSCAILSLLSLLVQKENPTDAPRFSLLRISLLVLASLVSGNVALKWVSYPVKVVVKSCKLLPTMALGAVLLRKRYSRYDQVAAVLLCSGLVGFTLSDRHGGSDGGGGGRASSPLGVGVLLFAVSCDAVQVLLSERMLRSSPLLTPNHVMMHTNGFAFVAVVAGMIVTGEAAVAPWASLPWFRLCIYGACSWVGVCCFIALTRSWGATAAVVATNARKLLTVALSFILFPKVFSASFALSGLAVVAGVGVHSYSRRVARAATTSAVKKAD
jgi:adenosine 3'-phospho 5'-phosphosulfate transporter B3